MDISHILKGFVACFVVSASANASSYTWVATHPNNNMNNGSSWSSGIVPGTNDNANFDSNLTNIDKNPTSTTVPFLVSRFNFIDRASAFNFNFNNSTLTFSKAGITGGQTNCILNIDNINNGSFPGTLLDFTGTTSSSGKASIHVTNDATLTGNVSNVGFGSIYSALNASGPFSMSSGGEIFVTNIAADSSTGLGNNGTANTTSSLVQFNQAFTAGDDALVSISNSGTFTGANNSQGDSVGIINGSQILSLGIFQVGNDFSCEVTNSGTNASSAIGLCNIGQINAAQMLLNSDGVVGDRCSLTISNTGNNSLQVTPNSQYIGYLNDEQLLVSGTLQAGNDFSLTVSNIGTDSSTGNGGSQVAAINSNSGTSGNQILLTQGGTFGHGTSISVTNSGIYTGTNTGKGSSVGAMNLGQLAVGDLNSIGSNSFIAGDHCKLKATNVGNDSAHGTGGDAVGTVSTDQIVFYTPCKLGDYAKIEINKSAEYSGQTSSSFVNVGSCGHNQLNFESTFEAGNNLVIDVQNLANHAGSGVGNDFVGHLFTGQQVNFSGGFTVGDHASILISNDATESSNSTAGNQVGILLGYGKQFSAKDFQVGDDLNIIITNTGYNNSTGAGGSYVGVINNNTVDSSGSQFYIRNGATVGDRASISLSNQGTFEGSTSNGNAIAVLAGQQFACSGNFSSGNDFNLSAINIGTDNATGINNQSVGALGNGGQVKFGLDCHLGERATIAIINSGTNKDSTGIDNSIGLIAGSQIFVSGSFSAGKNLNIDVKNLSDNAGNPSNTVGHVIGSQISFGNGCSLNDGALIKAFNSGSLTNSQIEFSNGFDIVSGKATIQAINEGTFDSFGIHILGSNSGGNAAIQLGNSWLNIETTPPTFTIGSLEGDSTSLAQSIPTLVISTDPLVDVEFAGTIQDYPSMNSTLLKKGDGTQKLSGTNTFTGLTSIEEGTLILTGSLAGDVNVQSSGKLKGTGDVFGNVVNMGTISPGESIGTIHFLSNFTNNGGNYEVEVNGRGHSDRIQITGDAILDGGVVIVSSADSTYRFQDRYTILETAGSRSGFFTGATAISSLIQPIVTYDPQHVYLTLLTNIQNAAETRNQLAVARQLDGIINPNIEQSILLSEIVGLPLEDAREALDSLSGYQHAADMLTTRMINRQFIRKLYDPIRALVTSEPDCSCICNSCSVCSKITSWTDIGGTFIDIDGRHHQDLETRGYHITLGAQTTLFQNLTFGVAGAYEKDRLRFKHSGGNENCSTWLAGLYGLYRPSHYYALIDVAYGNSSNRLKRFVNVGSLHYRARCHPDTQQHTFYGEVGIDFNTCSALVQPFFGVEACGIHRKGVRESFAEGWGLNVHKRNHTFTTTRLGVHATANDFFQCGSNFSLDLAWNYLASSTKNRVHERFNEFGTPFGIEWTEFDKNSIDYALTISTPICRNLNAYLEGVGESWNRANVFTILGGLEYSW